jgi:hypothetical protein
VTPHGGCSQSSGNAVTCIIRGASLDLLVSFKYEYFVGSCLVAERRYIFAGAGRIQVASKKAFAIGQRRICLAAWPLRQVGCGEF